MNKCKCGSERLVKNGRRSGKQCFLCRCCGIQNTSEYEIAQDERRAAITLCCFGLSIRQVARLMGYNHATILYWIRKFEKQREQESLYDIRSAAQKCEDDQKYFMQLDEVCEFLETRAQNPKFARRFNSMQEALTHSLDCEITKAIQKFFSFDG